MNLLVCGSTGCIGSAVVLALRGRGHKVVEAARRVADGPGALRLDFMTPIAPADWALRLRELRIDAVVNCVGILIPARGQSFERVHAQGPIELFRGAVLAGVRRIVQISALGVDDESHDAPYCRSKRQADAALAALPIDGVVLRPSLVYGPRSESGALFATLAALPVIGLPGRGRQPVQPIHVYEVAEIVARLLERAAPQRGVHELGGPQPIDYREMLATYRAALELDAALWLPVPLPLMRLAARFTEALPQRVFSRDTLRMLARGNVPRVNAVPLLLGRAPSALALGLAITPPLPALDLRARLSPALALGLRCTLAFMWLYTALISALLPDASGVLRLLARCGFDGELGVAVLVGSCALNIALGTLTLRRPSAAVYAWQAGAVIGYTAVAAFNMPELTIDHCGPLAKNVPLFGLIVLLWQAQPAPREAGVERTRRRRERSGWAEVAALGRRPR